MAWPCSSWISTGQRSPQEAGRGGLASCCLWSSPPLSCPGESLVTTGSDWTLDFIILWFHCYYITLFFFFTSSRKRVTFICRM